MEIKKLPIVPLPIDSEFCIFIPPVLQWISEIIFFRGGKPEK